MERVEEEMGLELHPQHGELRLRPPRPRLRERYTFESFVIGESNRFAHAAALSVAERPAQAYNPLFIHGSSGLGKTHLMHAVGNQMRRQNPSARIVYLHSEHFVADMVRALQHDRIDEFKRFYRSLDALLIDDIQFFAGKDRTQEEFFHTFNSLYQAGKQIVLSSDSPPKDIPTLQERLVSRFKWGLVTEIEPPCYETRMAILKPAPSSANSFMACRRFSAVSVRILSAW